MLKTIHREPIALHPGRSGAWTNTTMTEPSQRHFQNIPHYSRHEIQIRETGGSLFSSQAKVPQEPHITPFLSSPQEPVDLSSSPSKSASSSVIGNSSQKRKIFMTCIRQREEDPVSTFSMPTHLHRSEYAPQISPIKPVQ